MIISINLFCITDPVVINSIDGICLTDPAVINLINSVFETDPVVINPINLFLMDPGVTKSINLFLTDSTLGVAPLQLSRADPNRVPAICEGAGFFDRGKCSASDVQSGSLHSASYS